MRSNQAQTNFTSGEISKRMYGRTDLPMYASAVQVMENANPVIQGGTKRSPGSRYVATTKTSGKKVRLIPFVFNSDQGYILEFGDAYVRFYRNGAQIISGTPYEVVSPYPEAVLNELEYCQQADTLMIFHPSYAPRKLVRLSDASWKMITVPFVVAPYDEVGDTPALTLTLGAVTGATTATASAAAFVLADVGRQITSGLGVALITGWTSTTVVNITISDAFDNVARASGGWTLTGSPNSILTPSVLLTLGAPQTLTATTVNTFKAGFEIGTHIEINGGLVQITGFTSGTVVTGVVRSPLSSATAAQAGGWRRHSPLMGATYGYPSCGVFHDQRLLLSGLAGFPGALFGSMVGQYFNFSRVGLGNGDGFLFDFVSAEYNKTKHLIPSTQLLALTSGGEFTVSGGNTGNGMVLGPTTVVRSAVSEYGCNIVKPVKFGDDTVFAQASGLKVRSLLATNLTKYTAQDLTRFADHITGTGVIGLATMREPESFIYACRADGQMAMLTLYRDAEDVAQGVNGWARRTTDGYYESVARIPYGGVDQVWVVVARVIGGTTVRFVEYFDPDTNTDACVVGEAYVGTDILTSATWADGVLTLDSFPALAFVTGDYVKLTGFSPDEYNIIGPATVLGPNLFSMSLPDYPGPITIRGQYSTAPATAVWAGLSHLNGQTVDIVADGVVMPRDVVAAGQITLPRAAWTVEIGLHYTSTITLLPLEASSAAGATSIGSETPVHEVVVNLIDTVGLSINGEIVPFRRFGMDLLNQSVKPFTGTKSIGNLSTLGDRGVVTLTQEQPLPFHVVDVIRKYTFNA